MRPTTTWRRSWKDGAGAKVWFEAVYRYFLLAAANVDSEGLVTLSPLVWGRECGANGPSADMHVEGLSKSRWQLLGRLCIRQWSCWQWRGCYAEILHKVEWG